MQKYLQVGKIINTHGLKGEVKALVYSDDTKKFQNIKSVFIQKKDTINEEIIENSQTLVIDRVKYFKDKLILKFNGIDSIESAENLKNNFILIDRKDSTPPKKDSYFICDIIGCKVVEDDVTIGEIYEVIQAGSADVYVIKTSDKDRLIPALKTIILSVDIENKKIQVKIPEGL